MTDLDQLSGLDPVRDWEPGAERRALSTSFVDRLVREAPEPVHSPAPRRRLVFGLAATAITALAGAIVVPALLPGERDTAYASWTPIPRQLSGAEALPEARRCAAGWSSAWNREPAAPDILLAERRGIATMLVVAKDDSELVKCGIVDPADGVAGAELLDKSAPAPGTGRVSIQSMGAGGGATWFSDVIGRAAPDVTGVDIRLPDGTVVRATTRAGWWLAWWPGRSGGDVDAVQVIVHSASGSATYRPSEL